MIVISTKYISKSKSGQSLIEVAAALILFIPIMLVVLDCAMCMIAVMANDACCRDAARMAASGVPSDFQPAGGVAPVQANAFKLAADVVARVKSLTGYVEGPILLGSGAPDDPDTGPQNLVAPDPCAGGPWSGIYRVTTQVVVNLPASVRDLTPSRLTFRARQEYPITRNEQASY